MSLFFIRYLNRMKNILTLFVIFIVTSCFSQVVIKGTVSEKNGSLEGAAVYLNNTMFGTTTDGKGNFELPVKKGIYELIVSYLGYKKIVYNLNTETYDQPLIFTLQEEENSLDEVIIKKTVYDQNWKNNLQVFKKEFLGRSEFSQDCEILNEEVLFFDFDGLQNRFETFARKPLKIKNNALGYLITYELESFVRDKNYITYLGYSRYEPLKGGKRKQKKWKKNRLIAYNGSPVHFYKSLINKTSKQEGFVINQFKRVLNPERPSEEEIRKARKIVRTSRNIVIDLSKPISTKSSSEIDAARAILRKSRLPKHRDYLYKSQLKEEDVLTKKDGNYYLNFENNLSIVYNKEKEEMAYVNRSFFNRKKTPQPQTSSILPVEKNNLVDETGILVNPLSVIYEGYWSFEKFANTLPLDYVPNTEN